MAWERLAHFALSTAGDTIDTADDTSFSGDNFTAKQSMRVLVHIQDSGTCNVKMRFNGFSDQSYSTKYGESGANDGSPSTSATFIRCYEVGSGTDVQRQMTFEITNISDKEKHILGHTVESESTGASSIPKRVELAGKFDKTNQQITRIQLVNDASGSFGAGSYITVLGAKEPATASNLEVGSFTAKDYYHVEFIGQSSSGSNTNVRLIFNSDDTQTSKYALRESSNNGDNSTNPNQSDTDNLSGTNSDVIACSVNIMNTASPSTEPVVYISEGMSTSGIGANPNRKEVSGKFIGANTITKIKATTSSASWKEGSRLTVWGSDGASDTTYPTLVGGYIFEETNTGKHFMFDGTSTWTEIS